MDNWPPTNLWMALFSALLFGLLGLGLVVLGYKIFDWITPGLHIERELSEKHNIAVAIVIAAIILGVSWIVGHAMS
jgi:putative membrane protein